MGRLRKDSRALSPTATRSDGRSTAGIRRRRRSTRHARRKHRTHPGSMPRTTPTVSGSHRAGARGNQHGRRADMTDQSGPTPSDQTEPTHSPAGLDDATNAEALAEATLAQLRGVATVADPTPSLVLESAKAAFGLRRLDAELAELVHDSAIDADAVLVRGDDDVRMLSFENVDIAVEMQVTPRNHSHVLLAFVTGATGSVTVEHSAGEISVELDDAGRLRVEGIPAGPFRLHLQSE